MTSELFNRLATAHPSASARPAGALVRETAATIWETRWRDLPFEPAELVREIAGRPLLVRAGRASAWWPAFDVVEIDIDWLYEPAAVVRYVLAHEAAHARWSFVGEAGWPANGAARRWVNVLEDARIDAWLVRVDPTLAVGRNLALSRLLAGGTGLEALILRAARWLVAGEEVSGVRPAVLGFAESVAAGVLLASEELDSGSLEDPVQAARRFVAWAFHQRARLVEGGLVDR